MQWVCWHRTSRTLDCTAPPNKKVFENGFPIQTQKVSGHLCWTRQPLGIASGSPIDSCLPQPTKLSDSKKQYKVRKTYCQPWPSIWMGKIFLNSSRGHQLNSDSAMGAKMVQTAELYWHQVGGKQINSWNLLSHNQRIIAMAEGKWHCQYLSKSL